MKFFEILISIYIGYLFNYNIGITTYLFLKGIFCNNYKISLFMLLNLFVYMYFGPMYILFTKLYLISTAGIFFHENNMKKISIKDVDESKFKNIYMKILNMYEVFNILLSIPLYIIYDNLYNLLESYGYWKKICDNNLVNKINKNYTVFNEIIEYENNTNNDNLFELNKLNKLDNIDNIDNYKDEELDEILNNFFNPKNFMFMANDMRENIGKTKLSDTEIEDKMKEFAPLLEMFGKC